jgi:RepB DNA-primase from phage plasmid
LDDTEWKSDTGKALAMLNAFADLGVRLFDLTIIDINDDEVPGKQRPRTNVQEIRHSIGATLQDAERNRENVIIRPRGGRALLIQLDDFNEERKSQIEPYAFMTIRTSPGSYQVWLAVSDGPKDSEKEAAKAFRKRVRRGAKSDKSATGSTRIAGSLNFKKKYAPAFPVVEMIRTGRTVTTLELESAGLIAAPEPALPPASVPQTIAPANANRQWPDYQQALRGAPVKRDGSGPDRSLADFMWSKWAVQRGWSVDETAAKLEEVSEKARDAKERRGDEGYARVTAWNAEQAVSRDRLQGVKRRFRSASHSRQ